ncbi:hypothetical protein F2Q68_00014237 [Brassica cretica]|uniref:Uncharacterized protein n=1 Tax=Brassica cretica TaxID=69181 RepID=A0A8S9HJC6_BRACR|nr:hypothetical protein F2Q68_00014237 [Brassica cretica]
MMAPSTLKSEPVEQGKECNYRIFQWSKSLRPTTLHLREPEKRLLLQVAFTPMSRLRLSRYVFEGYPQSSQGRVRTKSHPSAESTLYITEPTPHLTELRIKPPNWICLQICNQVTKCNARATVSKLWTDEPRGKRLIKNPTTNPKSRPKPRPPLHLTRRRSRSPSV